MNNEEIRERFIFPEMDKEKFFRCDCGGEGLLISQSGCFVNAEIFLAMFRYGHYCKTPNIFRRLKYAWYHVWTGKRFADDIVLSFTTAKELGEYLIKITDVKVKEDD